MRSPWISAGWGVSEALYLGIDGGGSKCRARIRDSAGRLLGEANGGHANIYRDRAEGNPDVPPEAPGVAALTAGLRRQFDPRGIFAGGAA